jgi:hypothetical protein
MNQTESPNLRSQVLAVALTVDHATVSTQYSDGSFKDLGRVEGNEQYVSLMHLRFLSWNYVHPRYVGATCLNRTARALPLIHD